MGKDDSLRKKPGTNASVKIQCGNGKAGIPFPDGEEVNLDDICPSIGRDALNNAIPYIISPRSTRILTNQPILRWNAATNAKTFKVIVRGRGLKWTTEVSREQVCQNNICQLVYPGDPPLQPEVSYMLVIEATDTNNSSTNKSSTEITVPGLGFKLIEQDKAEEIRKNAQQIEAENLSATETALQLADLYADSNLVAEAIATLETLPENQNTSAVYRQLGELYQWIGLPLQAEVQYRQAVDVAEHQLERAQAQAGLAEVCWILDKKDEARNLLQAAKIEFENLGETEALNRLETRLKEMTQ